MAFPIMEWYFQQIFWDRFHWLVIAFEAHKLGNIATIDIGS